MASKPSPFVIDNLSGGQNDTDPPTALAPTQCVLAQNVEFYQAPCGRRRLGSTAITVSSSLTSKDAITFLHRHLPTGDESAAQLWAAAATIGNSVALAYKDTAWHDVTFTDAPTNTGTYPYEFNAVSLHGKLFLAYKSAQDRLHVWDGTNLRRTGLAQPAAPTAANTGAGTYSGTRYFRVRYTVQSGGVTILRSEPSSVLTFNPSGSGSAARITKPASISENETHWEVEASLDNANFYRIATVAVGTSTYDDSVAAGTGYAASGTLSEDIGDYTLIPSGRYLLVHKDRLVVLGSFTDDTNASVVRWTTVLKDPGVGNDERIPLDTDNLLNLDGYAGGGITGGAIYGGQIIVTKWSHIYRLVSTGQREQAYEPFVVTSARGAIPGSLVEAVDESGNPALYGLDPKTGPWRLGIGGLLWAGSDIYETWKTFNRDATTVKARTVFYPDKQQIHWWIATGSNNIPSLRLVLQVNNSRVDPGEGVRLGWSVWPGNSAAVVSACLFADNIEAGAARSLNLKPFAAIGNTIQKLDTGTTDNGSAYTPRIVSRPYLLSGSPLQRFGVRVGSVIATADATAVVRVGVTRNFGVETKNVDVPLAPAATENPVIKPIDNLSLGEMQVVEVELSDGTGNASNWTVHRIDLGPRGEEAA